MSKYCSNTQSRGPRGANCRGGVFSNSSNINLYPQNVISDSNIIDFSSHNHFASIIFYPVTKSYPKVSLRRNRRGGLLADTAELVRFCKLSNLLLTIALFRFFISSVQLSECPILQLSECPIVQLSECPIVQLSNY